MLSSKVIGATLYSENQEAVQPDSVLIMFKNHIPVEANITGIKMNCTHFKRILLTFSVFLRSFMCILGYKIKYLE